MKIELSIISAVIVPLLVKGFELPINIILHLDKQSPKHLETLQPWNSQSVPTEANLNTLTYVIGVFRHGNKPPTDTYVGDKYPYYDEGYWPNGHSQLTKVGKRQLRLLGRILRKRYNGFISEQYKNEEILVKVNPVDRVFMSASCLLFGLYPPLQDNSIDDESQQELQLAPVWEQPHDMSEIAKNPSVCPRFFEMETEVEEAINNFTFQYQDLVDYLNNQTGMRVTKLRDLYKYWNILYFQEQEGYGRPEWITKEIMDELDHLSSVTFTALLSSSKEMIKLVAGPLIKEFAIEIQEKISGKASDRLHKKMHLEGGHGTTLNAILPALGFKESFIPQLGSIFLMELHSALRGNFIQILYISNSTTGEIELLEIPDCGYECPLEKMLKRMVEIIPSNWKEECHLSGATYFRFHKTMLIFSIIFTNFINYFK